MIVTIGLISAYRSPKRNQRLLSLIILDIDYFKHYSDHYGHVKGDEAPPRRVAQTLSQAANRPGYFLACIGAKSSFGYCLTPLLKRPGVWRRNACN